jgi:hypothetical protein
MNFPIEISPKENSRRASCEKFSHSGIGRSMGVFRKIAR